MKWFKHISGSGSDPDIGELISEFGFKGYYLFFRTIEIMSNEFDIENPGKNTFNFRWFLDQFPRKIDRKTLLDFLENTQKKKRIFYSLNGKDIHLNCPKLKELTDEYTEKLLRQKKDESPDIVGSKSGLNPSHKNKNKKENKNKEDILGHKNGDREKELDEFFEKEIWSIWPRKEQRGKAKEKFFALVRTHKIEPQRLKNAVIGYLRVEKSKGTEKWFLMYLKTFFYAGSKKKKVPGTWEEYEKYADPKYEIKPRL